MAQIIITILLTISAGGSLIGFFWSLIDQQWLFGINFAVIFINLLINTMLLVQSQYDSEKLLLSKEQGSQR